MNSTFSLYYHTLYSDGLDRTARFPVDRYRLLAEKIRTLDTQKDFNKRTKVGDKRRNFNGS